MNKQESFDKKAEKEQKAMNWYMETKSEDNMILKESNSKYERFDNWLNSGSTEYIVEVKVRENYTSEKVERYGGAFLEFKKVEGIRQYKEKKGIKTEVLYFCFFKDCLNIYKIPTDVYSYTWKLRKLQKDDYNKSVAVNKFIAMLDSKFLIEKISYV